MKFLVFFLLVFASFPNCYGDAGIQEIVYREIATIEGELMPYVHKGLMNFTGAGKHTFQLRSNGRLGRTKHALVWKGLYSDGSKYVNQSVAIKIIHDPESMDKELMIFETLNATKNADIEKHGIPRVYYYGQFLEYDAIAMTLFDGTLKDRYDKERKLGRNLSDLTILSIFLQAVEGLQYLNGLSIVHNDIKPENMFLRGNKLFIGDFDQATIGGSQNNAYTRLFASANFYKEKPRHAMDDLESLVYSMWYICDVPMVREGDTVITEGYLLSECNKTEAVARMKQKCAHLPNQHVQDVFKYVTIDEVLSGKSVPDYQHIIAKMASTIDTIKIAPGPVRFEWLKESKSHRASKRNRK